MLKKHVENEADLNSTQATSKSTPSCRKSSIFDDVFISSEPDEVESHLNWPREPAQYDPITFWRTNSKKYPKLTNFAKSVLAIQATSVASERTFSRPGRFDTPVRNQLSCESF